MIKGGQVAARSGMKRGSLRGDWITNEAFYLNENLVIMTKYISDASCCDICRASCRPKHMYVIVNKWITCADRRNKLYMGQTSWRWVHAGCLSKSPLTRLCILWFSTLARNIPTVTPESLPPVGLPDNCTLLIHAGISILILPSFLRHVRPAKNAIIEFAVCPPGQGYLIYF